MLETQSHLQVLTTMSCYLIRSVKILVVTSDTNGFNYLFTSPPSSHNQTFYCPDQHQSGTAKLRLIPGHVDLLQGCSNVPSHRLVHCEALENSDLPRQII